LAELLDSLAALGLFGERFCQPLDLLLHLAMRRLQFLGSRLELGLFGARALLLCE